MNVPTIGRARGIFEIFVPGTFLLLNFGGVLYLLPFTDDKTKRLIAVCFTNPALSLVLAVTFGYLIGVLLRLFRADLPDKLSGEWLRWSFARWTRCLIGCKKNKKETELSWATEEFPYIGWIGDTCRLYLPAEAMSFYEMTWLKQKLEDEHNKQFFNFVKVIISISDEKAAAEIYAAEALTRYISGMFYALFFAFILISVTYISIYAVEGRVHGSLIFISIGYLIALMDILVHFRHIRSKEVEVVFAASFKNRSIFEKAPVSNTALLS